MRKLPQRRKNETRRDFNRTNAVRAATLCHPITNRDFVFSQLTGKGSSRVASSMSIRWTIEMIREVNAVKLLQERGGEDTLRRAAAAIIGNSEFNGFTFVVDHFVPHEATSYFTRKTMHQVKAFPDEATQAAIQLRKDRIQETFGFPNQTFYGGLVVAQCMSPDHAQIVSELLNESLAQQAHSIGIVAGPITTNPHR